MHQRRGAAQFCAAEVIGEAELEVSVSRLWLLALSHFCRAGHFWRDVSGWTSPDVTEIDESSTIFLSLDFTNISVRCNLDVQCVLDAFDQGGASRVDLRRELYGRRYIRFAL